MCVKVTYSQDITLLSISICEIIDNFYSKYSKNVDIINFGGLQMELVGKIMENLDNSMTVTLIDVQDLRKWKTKLEHQSILLFDYFDFFHWFSHEDFVELRYINPFRFVVYCHDATEFDVQSLRTHNNIASLYYIIIFDQTDDIFKLFTFENRNDLDFCHENQRLIKINEFSSSSQKWLTDPIFPKKYKTFHECHMDLGVQVSNPFFPSELTGSIVESELAGFGYEIMLILAEELKFTFQIGFCPDYNCDEDKLKFNFYNVLSFPIMSMFPHEMDSFGWRFVMINVPAL